MTTELCVAYQKHLAVVQLSLSVLEDKSAHKTSPNTAART